MHQNAAKSLLQIVKQSLTLDSAPVRMTLMRRCIFWCSHSQCAIMGSQAFTGPPGKCRFCATKPSDWLTEADAEKAVYTLIEACMLE